MPLAANNSTVIAATCYPMGEEQTERPPGKHLKLGVVCELDGNVAGHCAFSTMDPTFP